MRSLKRWGDSPLMRTEVAMRLGCAEAALETMRDGVVIRPEYAGWGLGWPRAFPMAFPVVWFVFSGLEGGNNSAKSVTPVWGEGEWNTEGHV